MKEQLFISKQRKALRHFHQISKELAEIEKKINIQRQEEINNLKKEWDAFINNITSKLPDYQLKKINEYKNYRNSNSGMKNHNNLYINGNKSENHLAEYINQAIQLLENIRQKNISDGGFGCGCFIAIIVMILAICSVPILKINREYWNVTLLTIIVISIAIFFLYYNIGYNLQNKQIDKLFTQFLKSLEKIYDEYYRKNSRIDNKYRDILDSSKKEFENKISNVIQFSEQFKKIVDSHSTKWNHKNWQKIALASAIPPVTRMGDLTSGIWEEVWEKDKGGFVRKTIKDFQFSMPLIFPFPGEEALLFKVNGSLKNTTAQRIQALLLRLLAIFPPGKLRFTFIDPVALGQNVAPFMHLADYDEALVTSKAWSDPRHIEQRLSEITEQMENVIQKYLRNTYATIEDYNKQAGEVAEPYRFLVVHNFPFNFTDEAARRLVSIVQNGPRCGVYTIILNDTEQQLPYGFNINDLERFSMVVSSEDNQLVWEEPNSFKCFIELEEPPSEEIFNNIINQVGKVAVENSKVEVPFEKILEKAALSPENWWQGSTLVSVQVPLGPIGANKIQNLELGVGTLHHALIAGRVGSGKSTLFHILITTSALKYSVEEIEFYLIDFKKGVEFKTYALHQLPHARVIAIESEREFGLSVIEGLDAELKRRGDAFRDVGVDSLKDYRPKTKKKLPRIMLIVDEFQEFFNENDAVASKASQILDRIVRQGRAFGIHVVLGSQTLAGAYTLARSTIDQMGIRIALQCSEADSRLILSDDNPAARLLSRPGEAIYNSANGLVEGNNPFQVAWLSDEKQKEYLGKIRELAKAKSCFPPQNQIIFEGNAPAKPEMNLSLNLLLSSKTNLSKNRQAWLGEPVAIKDATAATFRRQSGSNLLIVGQNDESAMGMLISGILTLSAQHAPNTAKFYVADFGAADAPHSNMFKMLSDSIPHNFRYVRPRQLADILTEISEDVTQRIKEEDEVGNSGEKSKTSVYLILYGLQRARDLNKDDFYVDNSGFGSGASDESAFQPPPNPGSLFLKIIREGSEVGIHTLAWCDTANNLNRRLDRQVLREFDMRVVFQMSEEDSSNIIDSPAANKLGQYRALFYSEEEGRIEKFRPFALPTEKWLKHIADKFRSSS